MSYIRLEEKSDEREIREIIRKAFESKSYSDGTEQDIVDELRHAKALSLSLVAVEDGAVIGQICFSPAKISSGLGIWFTLGPISVIPERQGLGIGRDLIHSGLEMLEEQGAWGCILVGAPRYYSRHGFELAPEHCPSNASEKHFQLYLISEKRPIGTFSFHEAFS